MRRLFFGIIVIIMLASCSDGGGRSGFIDTTRNSYAFSVRVEPSEYIAQEVVDAFANDTTIAAYLNGTFVLPYRPIEIIFQDCGFVNAFYDPNTSQLHMCWDLLAVFFQTADVSEALGMYEFVLWHELGHGLIDQYQLPVLGKEEDAADNIAVVFILASAPTDADLENSAVALLNAAMFFKQAGAINWADTHSVGPQRSVDLTCMAIAVVPSLVDYPGAQEDVALLQESNRNCTAELASKLQDVDQLMQPYYR